MSPNPFSIHRLLPWRLFLNKNEIPVHLHFLLSSTSTTQVFRNLTEALFQVSAASVHSEIRLFWAHCCNILYHNNITVNIRFIPAFVRLVQFLPAQGHSFNSSLDIICIEKFNIFMLKKKQVCYEKRPEPACRGFIRHC